MLRELDREAMDQMDKEDAELYHRGVFPTQCRRPAPKCYVHIDDLTQPDDLFRAEARHDKLFIVDIYGIFNR